MNKAALAAPESKYSVETIWIAKGAVGGRLDTQGGAKWGGGSDRERPSPGKCTFGPLGYPGAILQLKRGQRERSLWSRGEKAAATEYGARHARRGPGYEFR